MRTLSQKRGGRVLVVDDEESFVASLSYVLSHEGFEVTVAHDGEQALERARSDRPEVILLDVMLPGMSGVDVCRRLRQEGHPAAIIMLTARDGDMDTVMGLDAGADDYVSKPFNLGVLIARIRAALRRREHADAPVVSRGPLRLDPAAYSASWNEQQLDLTPKLFQLLMLLATNEGRVFSRDEILNKVWGYDFVGQTRTVDVHIHWLRDALATVDASGIIETVRSVGYRMVIPR